MATSSRPIMQLLDVLGRRWTLRILWELRADPLTFRALQKASGDLSPTVLNRRLAELRALDLVERSQGGYQLTRHGRELGALLLPLDEWARRWARRPKGAAGP